MVQALQGLLVVDASGTISTAYCTKQFADYGADVINIEPACGFPTRFAPPFIDAAAAPENSAMHAYLSTNKRSVMADALPDAVLAGLLTRADLLVDDGRTDSRIADLCDARVRMSISWYGEDGPYADFHGADAQIFALNGMLRSIGRVEGPPIIPSGYQAQIVGGMTAYIGALGHVLAAELGNLRRPVSLHTSIFEAAMCFTDVGAINYYNTGLEVPRMGVNRFPPTYPMGVFPCRDGWLGVTVLTPKQWHAFCRLLEMDDFADVPMFQTSIGRLEACDVIEPVMCERLLSRSAEDLFYRGQHDAIPLARVPTMKELFAVDQFVERSAFCQACLNDEVTIEVPSVPFRLFQTPPRFGGPVAALGEHTEQV